MAITWPRDREISYLRKHQWNSKLFHLNIFFAAKGAIYYVAIATVIFSHVKNVMLTAGNPKPSIWE